MEYAVTHGAYEQDLIKICLREKRPFPDFIRNAPELLPGLELYLNAFWDLNSCRQIGMDVGPIPWTAIQKYAIMLFDSPVEIEEFHIIIRAMDNKLAEVRDARHKELAK